jgi:putative salt-induced outer membrane protein YdiY
VVGYLGYEEDKKIKLDSEKVAMLGIERHRMGTKHHQFMAGVGIGKLAVNYTDGTKKRSATVGRVGLGYKGKLTDTLSFQENIVVLYSKDRTMKRATSSLNYALTDNVSIALSHEITHRNKIANTAVDKNDDVTDLKLVIKF